MSLANEYTNNFFMDESSILDAHLRLLFRAFHYETPCINRIESLLFLLIYRTLCDVLARRVDIITNTHALWRWKCLAQIQRSGTPSQNGLRGQPQPLWWEYFYQFDLLANSDFEF